MIYTPQKHPSQAMALIAIICLAGILGGLFIHEFIMIVALIFWLQYTAILTYLQFRHRHKHKKHPKTFAELLLRPQLRFFLFAFLAATGLFAVLGHGWVLVGALSLLAWLLFSVNFYIYYRQFIKYEEEE